MLLNSSRLFCIVFTSDELNLKQNNVTSDVMRCGLCTSQWSCIGRTPGANQHFFKTPTAQLDLLFVMSKFQVGTNEGVNANGWAVADVCPRVHVCFEVC